VNGTDQFLTTASDATRSDAQAQATRRPETAGDGPVVLDTAALMGGRSEVRLLHRGQEYRLRVTKQGKLILTK
jgi:hemin uptake protein HemP